MATINSFPNNSDEYIGAEEVMHWLHGRTSGVFGADGNAAVSAVPNSMDVSVSEGIGWMSDSGGNGIVWWSATNTTLSIDSAHSTLNRIDRIIVEWYVGDYSVKPEIKVLKGTNASTPSAPALTNNSLRRQISLAKISIPAGTTELTNLLITDERLDPAVCGIVTESITADTSMIANQYAVAVQTLYDAIAQAWSGVLSDGAVTLPKLANEVKAAYNVNVATLTIPYSSWTSSGSNYTQTITITDATITNNTKVDIQPSATVINQLINDGVNAMYIYNNNGSLIVYAMGAAPTANLSVQVTYYETV